MCSIVMLIYWLFLKFHVRWRMSFFCEPFSRQMELTMLIFAFPGGNSHL